MLCAFYRSTAFHPEKCAEADAYGDNGAVIVALHHAAQLFDQPSDAAVVGDHLRHAAAEQGQEEAS